MKRRAFLLAALLAVGSATAAEPTCGQPGQWFVPAGAQLSPADALDRLTDREMVLLGETHDAVDDHHWQLATLSTLQARHPDLAIGFEMFPRRVQPALDRWVRGELSEAEFLAQADWNHVWGMDTRLYLSLFQFARDHRIPMLALNVDSSLVKQVGARGLAAIPVAEREGVGTPAALPEAYRGQLQSVFEAHAFMAHKGLKFENFLEAQQFKDRAMAEAMHTWRAAHPGSLVVGILGAGHLRSGHGVPQQLRDLGSNKVAALATWPADLDCAGLSAGYTDLLYVVPPRAKTPGLSRLGIDLKEAPEGLRVDQVTAAGLGEKSGLKAGDLIVQAAGRSISKLTAAHVLVQRQPAGTWLPLQVRRGSELIELVVRFPVEE